MDKRISGRMKRSIEEMPLSAIEWVDRDSLTANNYNPNVVASTEMELLKLSILEDGWTQPLVVREDDVIIDGFHRWTVADDPEIRSMTDGKVPIVRLRHRNREEQMASTVRHNRARGTHLVLRMADIVKQLIDEQQLPIKRVQVIMGMDREEVERLYDRGDMVKRAAADDFNQGWVPTE